MKSLFGDDIPEVADKVKTGYCEIWKAQNRYRRSDRKERCSSCEQFIRCEHHGRVYLKCRLLGVSRSVATDIRVSCICSQYKRRDND